MEICNYTMLGPARATRRPQGSRPPPASDGVSAAARESWGAQPAPAPCCGTCYPSNAQDAKKRPERASGGKLGSTRLCAWGCV